jgi:hypothetical protein
MKSVHRAAFIAKKNKKEKHTFPILRLLIPLLILLGIIMYFKINTRVWNGTDKIAIAYRMENGDVGITVADSKFEEITTLIIPGDTQVDVARNLGTMRIKNVWQLGVNERIEGVLLPETITQNFLFPVFLWADLDASGLGSGNIGQILHFILIPSSTNISLGDRMAIGFYAVKVKSFGKTEINLGKSQFLSKQKLSDGQSGYVILGRPPERLTVYFSDNEIMGGNLRMNIVDATGESGISEKVGEILQIVGGKVVSVDKKVQVEDMDCVVFGINSKIVDKISQLFSCRIGKEKSTFDLDIQMGSKFAKRF